MFKLRVSFFFCENAGFLAISFLKIEIARWRVLTSLKSSASFFRYSQPWRQISRWRHFCEQCWRQHQSLLCEHVVHKKQQESSSVRCEAALSLPPEFSEKLQQARLRCKTTITTKVHPTQTAPRHSATGREPKPTVAVTTGAA